MWFDEGVYYNPKQYKVLNGLHDGASTRTGLFNLFDGHSLTSLFSGYEFWSELTAAILDPYLNTFLESIQLSGPLARLIRYDHDNKYWYLIDGSESALAGLAYALAGKFTETEATFLVMSQEHLNIVEYIDQDKKTWGAKTTNRNYGKVTIDITNGATTLTDNYASRTDTNTIASRTNTTTASTDTTTNTVSAFNSSGWENANKSQLDKGATSETMGGGQDTILRGGGQDTHTTAQYADKQETAARTDSEGYTSYIDTVDMTRHIVLSPDAYFQIQKEMADYNLLKSVRDAVMETVTKGVW